MYFKVSANSAPLLGLSSILSYGVPVLKMPGKSYQGELPPLDKPQTILRKNLRKHVYYLAEAIGERNLVHYEALNRTVDYIISEFRKYGYEVYIQEYSVPERYLRNRWSKFHYERHEYKNIVAELKGKSKTDEIIVVGSHYDSVPLEGCKGANDNASGVAAVLELAKHFAKLPQNRTIRFAAFTNEEPPFFWTRYMGSHVYAAECRRKKEKVKAMLTPETIGYYSDGKNSQNYPFPLNLYYPSTGNFIAFVANSKSKQLIKQCVKTFRDNADFPSEGACLPMIVPRIGSSDHWSFWKMGYPALMVTDTAPYRYPHYHKASDDPENVDFSKMARVVDGLQHVIAEIAN